MRAARLLAKIGDVRGRLPDAASPVCLARVAPSSRQPGKHKAVAHRWAVNKELRDAVCDFAGATRRANPWAAKIYNESVARGKDHPAPPASWPEPGPASSGAAGRTRPPTIPPPPRPPDTTQQRPSRLRLTPGYSGGLKSGSGSMAFPGAVTRRPKTRSLWLALGVQRPRMGAKKGVRMRPKLQDVATMFSRIELALAFLAAGLLGGLLNGLQEILPGGAPVEVKWFTTALTVGLVLTISAWAASRRLSLDLGACFIVRPGQLENRVEVSAALEQSSRSWLALEVVDHLDAWVGGVPRGVQDLAGSVALPLSESVGRPRVLLAVSCSDAVSFYLGNALRTNLAGADIHVMTLPTKSQAWRPIRYRLDPLVQRRFFEREELSGVECGCLNPVGVGVIDQYRSPNHNPETVLNSLLNQNLICCTKAVLRIRRDGSENEPLAWAEVLLAVRFIRSRSRWLVRAGKSEEVDLNLTVGPEPSMMAGLLLSGFFAWKVWEFSQAVDKWVVRWKSD